MMNLTARMPSVVSSSTSSSPGKTWYEYQDPGKSVVVDDGSGKPEKPSPPPGYSKEDYGRSWSSQERKSGAAAHDRSGKPEKTSWNAMQQVRPHREEPLLGRNAHSARYGELIHDRTGKPVSVHHQEQAYFENFVMGSDAAEFVNKVKDQVRNRQKKNVERCRFWRRAFNNSVNVHGCDDECGDIHGKEFLKYSKFHHEFQRSHFKAYVRHHCKSGGRAR